MPRKKLDTNTTRERDHEWIAVRQIIRTLSRFNSEARLSIMEYVQNRVQRMNREEDQAALPFPMTGGQA